MEREVVMDRISKDRIVNRRPDQRDQRTLVTRFRSGAVLLALASVFILSGCNLFGGSGSSANGDPALHLVPWCDRPSITFQDDSTSAQTIITEWSLVKDQLGFTLYLPESMPKGSCLALAGGSIHDPIYGGRVSITYVLPDSGPLAFSEAPKRPNMSDKAQCVQSTQDTKTTICLGAVDNTSVTIASRQSASDLQAVFGKLKANPTWQPTVQGTPYPTVTPTTGSTAPAATNTPTK